MKNLFPLIIFSLSVSAQIDWSDKNECVLPSNTGFVNNIVKNMTLEQKVGQIIMPEINSVTPEQAKRFHFGTILNGGGGFPDQNKDSNIQDWKNLSKSYYDVSTEVNGIKIPILWGTDAVHGHNNVIGATIFPHNIGLGATRNETLLKKIGEAVAKEVVSTGIIWTFAPTIAVPQNDLWGRTYEGYSENPELVSKLGKNFIIGLQGEGSNFLDDNHVLATAKHFLGDGGTFNGVDQGDTIISESLLKETHGMPYYDAIDSCAISIMASFNSWNGNKSHGSKYLLTDILKSQMQFDGFIVGDWNGHGQLPNCKDSNCPESFNAGVDVFMVPTEWEPLYWNTLEQVKSGAISPKRLDDAVTRILSVKKYLGLFDGRKPHEYINNYIGEQSHRAIARQAVRESIILLKNNNDVLPMNPGKRFLVVGNQSKFIENQMGGWTITWQGKTWEGTSISNDDFPNTLSIYDSLSSHIVKLGGEVEFSEDGTYSEKPDFIIMVYGETPYAEGFGDIDDLNFSNTNADMISKMKTFSKNGIPIVSLFLSGRPLIVDDELSLSSSFVSIWLPGTAIEGINDVIFTKEDNTINHDFKGKLSFSWPSKSSNNPLNIGDTEYTPLFKYGYGLTYSNQ
jgi:beta-glucosidase